MSPFKLFTLSCLVLIPTICEAGWGGFYLGGDVGGAFSSSQASTTTEYDSNGYSYFSPNLVSTVNASGTQNLNPNGFVGGAKGGYNLQLGNFVLGANLQYDSMSQTASNNITVNYPGNYSAYTFTINQKVSTSYLFTADPSLGYAIGQNFLIYTIGGFALTDMSYDQTFSDNLYNACESNQINKTLPGWAVGAGFEWKFSPNHWSLDTEYLHTDFKTSKASSNNFTAQGDGAGYSNPFYNSTTFSSNIMFFGLNYIF